MDATKKTSTENIFVESDPSNMGNDKETDAEDDGGDSSTSTSFSLEDCMNEFRARRIRRTYLHNRQEIGAKLDAVTDNHDEAEIDLINQNLCNKEQERKCKPCRDGFCYCFTSDSGDGGGSGLRISPCCTRGKPRIHHSRRRRFETVDDSGMHFSKKDGKDMPTYLKMSPKQKANADRVIDTATTDHISIISRLETSNRDDPLIHITQELRDNCFISEVKVNKHKLQSGRQQEKLINGNVLQKKDTKTLDLSKENCPIKPIGPYVPTAPMLDVVSELDSNDISILTSSPVDNISNNQHCDNRLRKATGGRLLQKRLSTSSLRYRTVYSGSDPPPKPPRRSFSLEHSSISTNYSSSSSARKAECILDEFLASRGYKPPTGLKRGLCVESGPWKSYPITLQDAPNIAKQVLATYPALSEVERVLHTRNPSQYERNIRNVDNNHTKVLRLGWNDPKIHTLSLDTNYGKKLFRNTETQAEPQAPLSEDCQIPPKIDIDTVDGIMHHNIATNIEKKNTPIKSELYNESMLKKRLVWSKQLRNFSPWSNKIQSQTESYKSNLRLNSKDFFKSSKTKILRLVSPKKNNKERHNIEIRKTPHRNVAVQTSNDNFAQPPICSYQSPEQKSLSLPKSPSFDSQKIDVGTGNSPFDFSRYIHSPPKKTIRPSQRKLNFLLNYPVPCSDKNHTPSALCKEVTTYQSFNGDLDQDASLSKMSFILSNIKAKLEESEERAIRTFRETENGEPNKISIKLGVGQPTLEESSVGVPKIRREQESIYSEIDDYSVVITERPNFQNSNGIKHFNVEHNPNVLYAVVNKSQERGNTTTHSPEEEKQSPTPLGKFLQNAIKIKRSTPKIASLPSLTEPSGDEDASTSSIHVGQLSHCYSLNNVRVMEHNSPPKRQRNLSKSDLYLHRSEIFFENLCKGAPNAESRTYIEQQQIQKRQNKEANVPPIPVNQQSPTFVSNKIFEIERNEQAEEDDVSYELPIDDSIGLSSIGPPSFINQSTPKKPHFITKVEQKKMLLNSDIQTNDVEEYNDRASSSCPNSPSKTHHIAKCEARSHSVNDFSEYQINVNKCKSTNILPTFKLLKTMIHNSFRKSKKFVKNGRKRISPSLYFIESNSESENNIHKNVSCSDDATLAADVDLDSLLSINQFAPIDEQLTHLVNICRHLPHPEISTELVEAERLLLFSELRRKNQPSATSFCTSHTFDKKSISHFFIDDIYIPIEADANLNIFFNYFYIVTFECGGIIRSTQSTECQNGFAVFQDCGMEFFFNSESNETEQSQTVRCNIFSLRLRKVSALSLEPIKMKLSESIRSSLSTTSSQSSSDEIVSRFRLHASFNLNYKNFIPYEYVAQESEHSDHICLRASKICNIMLISSKLSTSSSELLLKGRAEIRIPKQLHSGFLNVEDPQNQHNWNRRWCILEGIYLQVWQDDATLNQSPLLTLDLRANQQNFLRPASRELCARPRSFCIVCALQKNIEEDSTATFFFAADTQKDLNIWLDSLNKALYFIKSWM